MWSSYGQEATRGETGGHRLTRHGEAMGSLLLPCAHRVVPARERGPEQRHASESAVDAHRDHTAGVPRAERPKNVGTATGNSINWIGMASRRTWWPRLASAPMSRGERLRGKSSRAPVTPPQRSPDTAAKRAAPRVTARPLPAQQLCLLALKLLACQIALFQEPG